MDWMLTHDALGLLPSALRYATAQELEQLERDLILAGPAALAQMTSGGRWQPARHLILLNRAILQALDDAAAGRLDGLVVSMPPQHGKIELSSHYLPAWYIGMHPERRVILIGYEADFAAGWGRMAREVLTEHGHLFGVRVARTRSAARRWDLQGHAGGEYLAVGGKGDGVNQ